MIMVDTEAPLEILRLTKDGPVMGRPARAEEIAAGIRRAQGIEKIEPYSQKVARQLVGNWMSQKGTLITPLRKITEKKLQSK